MNLGKIGKLGEDIAIMFLKKHNYNVFTRNFYTSFGEIDIVALKNNVTHFIEVKSVSREIVKGKPIKGDLFDPQENMHKEKVAKLLRTINVFLSKNRGYSKWVLDLILVYIDIKNKKSVVRFFEDVVIE